MATILSLLPRLQAYAPEAPEPMLARIFVEAARKFCRESRAWRSDVSETVTASTLAVAITPPTDSEVIDIASAVLDDEYTLDKRTVKQLDRDYIDWRTDTGSPAHVALSGTLNEIYVAPLSDTTYTSALDLELVLQPTLTATTFDDALFSKYEELITNAALGALLMIPRKLWSDSKLALYHMGLYQEAIDAAKSSGTDGGMSGIARVVQYGGY